MFCYLELQAENLRRCFCSFSQLKSPLYIPPHSTRISSSATSTREVKTWAAKEGVYSSLHATFLQIKAYETIYRSLAPRIAAGLIYTNPSWLQSSHSYELLPVIKEQKSPRLQFSQVFIDLIGEINGFGRCLRKQKWMMEWHLHGLTIKSPKGEVQ